VKGFWRLRIVKGTFVWTLPPGAAQVAIERLRKVCYTKARNGDHYLVPFKCDGCIFRKLKKSDPILRDPQDDLLLACIGRMNLDAFWVRAKDTLKGNRDKLVDKLSLSKLVGLQGPCLHDGPYPDYDYCGYEVAMDMLLMSTPMCPDVGSIVLDVAIEWVKNGGRIRP
jgi:hypothetical protein